jgi:5'-nucleotidase
VTLQSPVFPTTSAPRKRGRTVTVGVLCGALTLSGVGLASLPASAAVSADAAVVINEVYGGGGNSGATLTNDFVELVNVSDQAIDITGWSLQYASASGAFANSGDTNRHVLTGTIAAGGSFLVQESQGNGGTTALPTPDASGGLTIGGSGGKVALASDGVTVTAPGDANVVDYVAWGNGAAPAAGGAAAPATTNTTSVSRSEQHANTANNGADFTAGAPTPQNSGAGENPDPEPDPDPTDPPAGTSVTIAQLQGEGAVSPYDQQTVTTEGVVTAHYPTGGLNGYVIQTAGTGGAIDFATHKASDAVFVYSTATLGTVELGDTVRVTGRVSEYFGQTQITVAAGAAQVLADQPAPIPATVAWPADETQRESLEQMLLAPQGAFTVSDTYATNNYGEVGLAAGTTPLRQPTDVADAGSAEAATVAADNAARGVILDDGASTNFLDTAGANAGLVPPYVSLQNPVVVGASVTFESPVILAYGFDLWRFQPTRPIVGDGTGENDGVSFSNVRTPAPAEVGGDVSVASFNVLNYFTTLGTDTASCTTYTPIRNGERNSVSGGCDQRGAWDSEDFERQESKIVAAINDLDASVVGLMEIENSAALGEGVDEATSTLVDALNAASAPGTWAFVPSSSELPAADTRDVITNAIIYQPAAVTPVGASRALGTLSDDGEAFGNAREPIGQVFAPADGGEDFLFVVNHFKSKSTSGASGAEADQGDGQGAWNPARVRQAEALRDWIPTVQGDTESVILVGDFNSYGQEDPLQALYAAGYTDAEASMGDSEWSYTFDGMVGSLDHVLLNEAAAERATGADIWNINSGESIALEYSRYRYHGASFYEDGPYRSSDHDPVKVGLTADGQGAPVELTLLGINDFHGRIDTNTVKFAGTVEQLRDAASGPSLFLSVGDNIGASLFASSYFQDQPTLDVLNALELETSAVGNHEFDKGLADLTGRVTDEADFSYLGANVYQKGTTTPALPEFELLDADGLTVGVIGAVTSETGSLVSPSGIATIEFGDPVEAVNRVAAQLSDGDSANGEADVLVALYHEGASAGDAETTTLEAELAKGGIFADIVEETSPEVGAIFTGHTHKKYAWSAPIPGTEKTRPILQTGSYGENIGKIVLEIDRESGEVLSHTQENVARTTADDAALVASYPRVAEVKQIVDETLEAAKAVGNVKVAEVSADITTAFTGGSFVDGVYTGGSRDNRGAESSLGNLVAEALRSSMAELPNGAEIGVTNPGGLRAELYDTQAEFGGSAVSGLADGDIAFAQANAVLPFNNTTTLVTLTGAQFIELLNQQWQPAVGADGKPPSRAYLQLGLSDNVSYTYDPAQPAGSRITSVTVDGAPLQRDAEYRIGTLSFLADGGDNFTAFQDSTDRLDTGNVDYQAWIDYLSAETPVAPSYAKHAVQVQGSTTAAAGTDAEFTVSNLNLTSLGTPETTELEVAVDGADAGTVPVSGGSASISVPVPADAVDGDTYDVTLTSETGTVVSVVVTAGEPAPEPPTDGEPGEGADNGSWATVVVSPTTVAQGGTLRVSVSGLEPGQQIAATLFSEPIVVTGIPAADADGRTSFTIAIPADFDLGAHTLVVTTAGEEPIRVGLTVVAAGALAATGAQLPLGLALGGAFLLVAGGLVFLMRKRRRTLA